MKAHESLFLNEFLQLLGNTKKQPEHANTNCIFQFIHVYAGEGNLSNSVFILLTLFPGFG